MSEFFQESNTFSRIRDFFSVTKFEPDIESEYRKFRDREALPIVGFAFIMGGTFSTVLSIIEWTVDGQLSAARWLYIGIWVSIVLRAYFVKADAIKAFCLYMCVSAIFFIYHYYFEANRPLYIVPTINLLLTAIIVSKIGARLSTLLALFVLLCAFSIFYFSNQMNSTTSQILILMCFTTVVVCLSSIILEKSSRNGFYYMMALKKSRKEAQDAGTARLDFLASMSHEIRTPLTAIIGYAQSIVDQEAKPEKHPELVSRIKTNGDHLLRLVNGILDLSKIDQGKLELFKEPFLLLEFLRDLQFSVENLAVKKSLSFQIEYKFPLPSQIIADRVRLMQILVNLVGNAIKFTEVGGVTVKVSADDKLMHFSVEDTGIGITDDAAKRIFQHFEQGNEETYKRFGGSGLGLAISKRLAILMGGNLFFSRSSTQGSTFIASIGLDMPAQSEWIRKLDNHHQQEQDIGKDRLFEGRVLVADDIPDNRKLITLILENLGVDVDSVENGELALEQAMLNDYDLILMDIQMPVLDGVEAVSQLRSFGNQTPVVALTANVMDRDISQYLSIGFNGHLGKPIDRAALSRMLKNYLTSTESSKTENKEFERKFRELQQQYIAKLKQEVESIQRLCEEKRWSDLASVAHSIKGAASSFKLDAVADYASQLEVTAQSQQASALELAELLCREIQGL